ncbi:hypothetical protein GGF31_004602 [Allomyces arbusculus]|nr:hypothetical protein GGF31_004602 [Allomyces arbusculus]
MALRLTTPHDVSLFALTQHQPFCPALLAVSGSILSDDWHWRGIMGAHANDHRLLPAAQVCLGGGRTAVPANRASSTKPQPDPVRYQYMDPPAIAWLDPTDLIPHEPTSAPHLARLVEYLRTLDDDTLLPTIIVTRSHPHVILDGHHRWQASVTLGIPRVPCWVVDDRRADTDATLLPVPPAQFLNATDLAQRSAVEEVGYRYYRVRVYDTRHGGFLRIGDIAQRARDNWRAARTAGGIALGFGIKGTKHVAQHVPLHVHHGRLRRGTRAGAGHEIVFGTAAHASAATGAAAEDAAAGGGSAFEVRLEKVAPRVEWGLWKSAGARPFATHAGVTVDASLRPLRSLGEEGTCLWRDAPEPPAAQDDGNGAPNRSEPASGAPPTAAGARVGAGSGPGAGVVERAAAAASA